MPPPIPARTRVEWWAGVRRLELAAVRLRAFDVTSRGRHALELQFPLVLLMPRQQGVMQFQEILRTRASSRIWTSNRDNPSCQDRVNQF
jgi:hypothetical protein